MKKIHRNVNARYNPFVIDKSSTSGITLVSLVVTIIVMIILAGVSITGVLGENGIIEQSRETADSQEMIEIKSEIKLELLAKKMNRIENGWKVTHRDVEKILSEYGTINYNDDETIRSVTTNSNYEILLSDIWDEKVREPRIENTGLIAVYWNAETSKWVDLTEESTQEEWDNWYNYKKQKWANARSADGSMWVWIPRYEYKIDSTNQIIDVKFIEIGDTTTEGYILHPAFTTDIENGGWDEELPGFWVAKYAAGFQNSTVGEEIKTVETSPTLKYTVVSSSYATNFFGGMTVNTTPLSYPVFKANTYAYNLICLSDMYLLSKEIDTASMYGLSNVDSHLMKNSEWGAVAYLTHSKYGVNGNSTAMNEVTTNNKNLNDSIYVNNGESGTKANIYAVTSYGNNGTPNDVNASTTKNMTGVFDLNGCIWEHTAGYLKGKTASNPTWHNAMASSTTTESTKYFTLYTANDKIGDATNETSGWNSDSASFPTKGPIFMRGSSYAGGTGGGIFAYSNQDGQPRYQLGFRVCLAF